MWYNIYIERRKKIMKQGATFKENIEFLLSMYKRELELAKEGKEELSLELEEAYENIIIELETILQFSK
jgi:hypothetical protein